MRRAPLLAVLVCLLMGGQAGAGTWQAVPWEQVWRGEGTLPVASLRGVGRGPEGGYVLWGRSASGLRLPAVLLREAWRLAYGADPGGRVALRPHYRKPQTRSLVTISPTLQDTWAGRTLLQGMTALAALGEELERRLPCQTKPPPPPGARLSLHSERLWAAPDGAGVWLDREPFVLEKAEALPPGWLSQNLAALGRQEPRAHLALELFKAYQMMTALDPPLPGPAGGAASPKVPTPKFLRLGSETSLVNEIVLQPVHARPAPGQEGFWASLGRPEGEPLWQKAPRDPANPAQLNAALEEAGAGQKPVVLDYDQEQPALVAAYGDYTLGLPPPQARRFRLLCEETLEGDGPWNQEWRRWWKSSLACPAAEDRDLVLVLNRPKPRWAGLRAAAGLLANARVWLVGRSGPDPLGPLLGFWRRRQAAPALNQARLGLILSGDPAEIGSGLKALQRLIPPERLLLNPTRRELIRFLEQAPCDALLVDLLAGSEHFSLADGSFTLQDALWLRNLSRLKYMALGLLGGVPQGADNNGMAAGLQVRGVQLVSISSSPEAGSALNRNLLRLAQLWEEPGNARLPLWELPRLLGAAERTIFLDMSTARESRGPN